MTIDSLRASSVIARCIMKRCIREVTCLSRRYKGWSSGAQSGIPVKSGSLDIVTIYLFLKILELNSYTER